MNWFFHEIEEEDGSRRFWDWSIEKELLFIGWGLLFLILAGYLVLIVCAPDMLGEVTCLFRILFGVYCPVCGGSRAAWYLATGHILQSLYYNPAVFAAAVICIPFLLLNTMCYATKGRFLGMRYHNIYLFVIIAAAILNCIWKNYALLAEGIALIP